MPHEVELADAPSGWQLRKCSNLAIHPLAGWAV
jgi:4-diphosphocytidyl-2-C-methyl-D-erythritol kinase